MFPDVFCDYVVGAEKIFAVCLGDGGGQSVGRGGQYLLELGVGGITHELQNEPFAGGEEGAALVHPGQRHQPVHLAAGGGGGAVCVCGVSALVWTPRHLANSAGIPPPGSSWVPQTHPTCTPPLRGPSHLREEQASTTTWTCSPWSRRSRAVC